MKKVPEIVKILCEEEKLGKLSSRSEEASQEMFQELELSGEALKNDLEEDSENLEYREEIDSVRGKSEGLYRTLVENLLEGILILDFSGRVLFANPAIAKMFGFESVEGAIGKNALDFVDPKYRKRVIKDQLLVKMGKGGFLDAYQVITADGRKKWVEGLGTKIKYKGKRVNVVFIRDITERKKAEEKVRTLAAIVNEAKVAIATVDMDGIISTWNKSCEEMLGYSTEETIGKIAMSKICSRADEQIQTTFREGYCIDRELGYVAKDGRVIPCSTSTFLIKDETGTPIGIGGIAIDITERKMSEEFVRESEKKFRDIFDATSDLLLYLDPAGNILDINNAAVYVGGLEKGKIIGKSFSQLKGLFSKEDMKRHLEAIDKAVRGEKINDYECELVTKDGIRYRFLFSNDFIKEKEEVTGILVRGRDVTQRQRAWDELAKLEERYRVLAETSADGVITIDPLGRLTYVNPSFERMCKRRKSKILATLLRNCLSYDSVYLFQQIFIDARKKFEKIENVELELAHPDGNTLPIEVNIAPLKKDNEFAGTVCTIRDITERKKVEEELKKSERLKTEFMNIAAHELKSPITPIKGYLDLIIQDKDANEKIKNWARISQRNSERLLKLVTDILDVSRLDTDTMRFDMEKLDPVKILDEIVEDMKPTIEDKNLELVTIIPSHLPSIMGDRHRLSQVLENLIGNAVKFTDSGSITIGAKKNDKHILISVEDTGIGISQNELKKIFLKFYQAYTGDDRKSDGTGLGLFICEEIIEKHNGEIWVESELRKGSKFIIKLPHL